MNRLLAILFCLLFALPSGYDLQADDSISGSIDYYASKLYSQYLLHRFNPATTLYVGIGASPTTIIAFLQNYSELVDSKVTAINLPLSASGPQLELEEAHAKLSPHFRTFLQNDIFEGKERVVFIDYAESGETIRNTFHYLSKHLAQEGMDIPVHGIALQGASKEALNGLPIDRINITSALSTYFQRRLFRVRDLAEHSKFSLAKAMSGFADPVEVNPRYSQLKETLKKMMSQDQNLTEQFDLGKFAETTDHGKYGSIDQTPLWIASKCRDAVLNLPKD